MWNSSFRVDLGKSDYSCVIMDNIQLRSEYSTLELRVKSHTEDRTENKAQDYRNEIS